MTEGTSTTGAPAAFDTAGSVAAAPAANAAAPTPAPVDARLAAIAAESAPIAPLSVPNARPAAPAVGPAAAAIAAAEAAAAIAAASAKQADKVEAKSDSDETSMSDAEMLPEVELASLGDAGAGTAGQPGLPCGVLPVVDAPVVAAPPPVVVPVGDAGFALSPALLGLLGLGALGLGYLLLRDNDDKKVADTPPPNEPPIAADDSAAVDENGTVSGSVATNDSDPDGPEADLTYALNASVAGLTLNADGSYTFDAANSAYDELAAGETQVVTANYTVTDPDGGTDTATLTITINGVNDAPILVAPATADVDENAPGAVVLDADATDPNGDAVVFSLEGADAGSFTIDPVTGVVTINQGADFETQVTYNITVVATDTGGLRDTQDVVVSVNDLPEPVVMSLDVDNDANTLTPFVIDAGAEWYQFMDDDDIANNVTLINFGAEDYIVFDAPFTGTGAVAFSSEDTGDGDGLDDLLITVNNGGTVTEIRIEDVATGIVFDEATAEAAVAGTNTFRTTATAMGTTSLDTDPDANPATPNIIDAGGGNIAYFDDADIANNTTITGFDDGDTITTNANGTTVMAMFSNIGDSDADGFGDLMISINNGGVLSVTVLEDAIAADAVVTNEATAEAAIGFDFFSYA